MIAFVEDSIPEFRQLEAQHPDRANQIGLNIANLESWVAQQIPGSKGVRNYKHTVNLFSRYRFDDSGPLRGFSWGIGMNYRSAPVQWSQLQTGPDGSTVASGYGGSRVIFNGMVGYSKRFARVSWTVNLHLNNLTNKEYFEELSLGNTRYARPANWSLTNTVRF